MRRIIILTSISICLCGKIVTGQVDSIVNESPADLSKNKLEQKNEYLNANLREEKTLIKIGISPSFFLSSNSKSTQNGVFGSSLMFEKKIIPSFSLLLSNNFNYRFYNSHNELSFSGDIELRYYYLIRKRIKESIGANNFHSNYFSLKLNRCFSYRENDYEYYYDYDSGWTFRPDFGIEWGMQRRIGKWGFYDFGIDLCFSKFNPYIGGKLILGLCHSK